MGCAAGCAPVMGCIAAVPVPGLTAWHLQLPSLGLQVYSGDLLALTNARLRLTDAPRQDEVLFLDLVLCIPFRFIFGYAAFKLYRCADRCQEAKLESSESSRALLLPYLYLQELKPLLAMGIGAAWAAHPFVLPMLLGSLRSRMSFFILAYSGVLSTFRWLELAASLGPKGFDATATTFALYFSMPAELQFEDGKLKFLSGERWRRALDLLLRLAFHSSIMLIALSVGKATRFQPFLEEIPAKLPFYGLPWSLPALYLQTVWVYRCLTLPMLYHRIMATLFGLETLVTMKAPLTQSTSIRDFWGRRWNLIVHNLMKRCFFMPFQHGGPVKKNIAGFVSFLMSGVFHEYMWLMLHLARPEGSRYSPGKVLVFFVLQYLATAVQVMLVKTTWLGRRGWGMMPTVLQTVVTTICVLPFGPLFLEGVHDMINESSLMPAVELL